MVPLLFKPETFNERGPRRNRDTNDIINISGAPWAPDIWSTHIIILSPFFSIESKDRKDSFSNDFLIPRGVVDIKNHLIQHEILYFYDPK